MGGQVRMSQIKLEAVCDAKGLIAVTALCYNKTDAS
jgi:hypothetical protein